MVALAVGTAAGGRWIMDDCGGAGVDYTAIKAAVDVASAGTATQGCEQGQMPENLAVNMRHRSFFRACWGAIVERLRSRSNMLLPTLLSASCFQPVVHNDPISHHPTP